MSDNNQPAFAMMPFPMMMGGSSPSTEGDQVPARIKVGLVFLRDLTNKTMVKGMANDVGFDTIEGQKLEVEERQAQNAACKMLTDYFNGILEPTEEERKPAMKEPGEGATHQCFHCLQRGEVSSRCRMCNGSGQVIVFAGNRS